LCDQLLIEGRDGLRIGPIIADQKLNRTPEDSALLVYMLLAEQVALTDVVALHLVSPVTAMEAPIRIGCWARLGPAATTEATAKAMSESDFELMCTTSFLISLYSPRR